MKILIVGGAEYSADLSTFDEVVAINDHHPKIDKRIICENTDLIYESKKPFQDIELTYGIVTRGTFLGSTEQYKNLNPRDARYEWSNILRKQYNFKPFTGIFALHFFRSVFAPGEAFHDEGSLSIVTEFISSIHLDGMTLYHDKGADGNYVKKTEFKRHSHNILANIRYLQEVKRIDARVSYSDELEKVLALYD